MKEKRFKQITLFKPKNDICILIVLQNKGINLPIIIGVLEKVFLQKY